MTTFLQVDAAMFAEALVAPYSKTLLAALDLPTRTVESAILLAQAVVDGRATEEQKLAIQTLVRQVAPSHQDFVQTAQWASRVLDPLRVGRLDRYGLQDATLQTSVIEEIDNLQQAVSHYGDLAEAASRRAGADPTEPSPYSDLYVVLEWQAFRRFWSTLSDRVGGAKVQAFVAWAQSTAIGEPRLATPCFEQVDGQYSIVGWA